MTGRFFRGLIQTDHSVFWIRVEGGRGRCQNKQMGTSRSSLNCENSAKEENDHKNRHRANSDHLCVAWRGVGKKTGPWWKGAKRGNDSCIPSREKVIIVLGAGGEVKFSGIRKTPERLKSGHLKNAMRRKFSGCSPSWDQDLRKSPSRIKKKKIVEVVAGLRKILLVSRFHRAREKQRRM